MTAAPLVAGIELGGTKSIALLARGRDIVKRQQIKTGAPAETIDNLMGHLASWRTEHDFKAIGIASFGPLAAASNGLFTGIAETPKPGWRHTALVAPLEERFALPIALDTDVVGAGLAEWRWGAQAGAKSIIYLTIGTGIGGAMLVDGSPTTGFSHAEMGHVRVRRHADDRFAGVCPFHGDCLEGLASGPAIQARVGEPASDLPSDHPVWASIADAIAELATALILTAAPHHIMIGGGVGLSRCFPLDAVRRATLDKLGGYIAGVDGRSIGGQIVQASLGELAGPLGAIAIAERVLNAPAA